METKPETQDVEVEGGEWVAHRDRCLQPAASALLLSWGLERAWQAAPVWRAGRQDPGKPWEGQPSWSTTVSGHLQTTRLHLSFCIADVFLKQLDVSELDRSALLRI